MVQLGYPSFIAVLLPHYIQTLEPQVRVSHCRNLSSLPSRVAQNSLCLSPAVVREDGIQGPKHAWSIECSCSNPPVQNFMPLNR